MISRKELVYVDKSVGTVPYPGDEYAYKVMRELKDAYKLFEDKYDGKNYSIILSNGQEFEFAILNKNLCHMLGISAKNITTYGEDTAYRVLGIDNPSTISTYELLGKIIERTDDVLENERKDNTYKMINFYKVMIKTAIFKKMTEFKDFNFGFINFDRDKYEKFTREGVRANSTKYIFMPSEEVAIPYFFVGFVKNNGGETYVPETVIAPEDFYNYLGYQELLLPLQILIDDNKEFTKLEATPSEKLKTLQKYNELIQCYKTYSKINIYNDYMATLMSLSRNERVEGNKLILK